MKICVVGPGALGCLMAGYIKNKTNEECWLLDRSKERAAAIKESGIKIDGSNISSPVRINCVADSKEIGICDLVIIAVKSYSTEEACKDIKDIVSEKTIVLTLQNGIGNIQILNDYFGPERVIGGITNHGATLIGPGHTRHAGKGETIIGKTDGRTLGPIRDIARVLDKAGFDTKITKDINSVLWSKLIINAGINALTAITRLRNGKLIEYISAREVLRAAVGEAVKIAKRKRIKLSYDDPIQKVESVAKATASNLSSMLQDVLNKRRTEIEFINGAIIRQGKALSIPTPVNETLTGLVKTIEASYEEVTNQQ